MLRLRTMDYRILNCIQGLRCGFLDFLMPKITALGNKGAVWIITALCMCVSKNYRRMGIMILLGLSIGVLVCNIILKPLVARRRPRKVNLEPLPVVETPDYSFPSGHTLSSFVSALIITCSGSLFGCIAIPLAMLIAFSRLYLYLHFPSDVLGGAALAVAIVAFIL